MLHFKFYKHQKGTFHFEHQSQNADKADKIPYRGYKVWGILTWKSHYIPRLQCHNYKNKSKAKFFS